MTDTTASRDTRRPFVTVVQDIEHGYFSDQATARLAEVVAAVVQTGKKGSLTVRLDVSRFHSEGAVEIHGDLKANVPEPDRDAALLWADGDGGLHRHDLRQTTTDDI